MIENDTTPSNTDEGKVEGQGETNTPTKTEYSGKLTKFKSVEDLEKSYEELEKKMGGWSDKEKRLSELEAFEKQATPVINFMWSDEDTLKKFRDYATGSPKETATVDKANNLPEKDSQVVELVLAQESAIVSDFERKHGLDRLSPDEAKKVRLEVGKEMAALLDGKPKPSLRNLPTLLEKSYILMNAEKFKESGKVEGFVEALRAQGGAIGSATSSSSKSDGVILTSEQRKIAHKMGISEEDYATNLQKISKSKTED